MSDDWKLSDREASVNLASDLKMQPLEAPSKLSARVVTALSAQIEKGALAPGDQLPTEQQLSEQLGVSRTVVREAVASLRTEGMLVSQQGVGTFVAKDATRRPFRIDPEQLSRLHDVLRVMELRLGIETEAAGLAAERRTPKQMAKIEDALNEVQAKMDSGEGNASADFAFHCVIAEATNNLHFVRLLDFLGTIIIPRQTVQIQLETTPGGNKDYLDTIQNEHRMMVAAIAAKEPGAARDAVRLHLGNSIQRYTKIARRLGDEPGAEN